MKWIDKLPAWGEALLWVLFFFLILGAVFSIAFISPEVFTVLAGLILVGVLGFTLFTLCYESISYRRRKGKK